MKTVVIVGSAPLPGELREIIERGSTSIQERQASDVSDTPPLEADRLLFWSATAEADVLAIAGRYAAQWTAERGETVMFVSGDRAAAGAPFEADQLFVWPADEDRLKMAFLTGA